MSAITAKASRKMKKYAVLTREPRCFLGSFDFSWEQRKFEEIAVRSSVICSDDTLPRVEYEDIVSGTGRLNKDIYAKQSIKSGIAFHQGDVLYGKLRPYLQNWLLPTFDGLAVGDFWVLQPQNADSSFLYRLIQSRQFDEVANQSTGTKMPRADWKLVSKTVFSIPSNISEQAAIGTYFTALDSLITLHQRKCANLCSPSQVVFSLLFATSTFSWEQRKLSEITDKVTEKNAGLQYVETFTNSAEFGIISQRDFFDHDIAKLGSLDGYYIVKNEDFVYNPRISTSAPVGPINRNKLGRTGVMSPLYTVFRPHDIDTTYLEYFFKCGYWHSFMNFNGDSGARSDRFSIRDNVFFQMPIPIPDIDEQRKIGELLTCLDNLITLHQRECISFTGRADRLILTANKKRTTSSWEQRKLGEMGQTYTGLSGKTKDDFGHGQARFVTYMNVFSNPISNPEMTEPIEIDPKQNAVEVGDVFFTTSSETPEEVGMSSILLEKRGKTYLNSFCFGFRPSEKIDSYYLAYMLRSESTRAKIILLAQGISRYNISKNKVMEIAVSLPSLDEQKMIGQYFSQLDNLITLHQRKPFLMKWRTSDANRNQTNRLVL